MKKLFIFGILAFISAFSFSQTTIPNKKQAKKIDKYNDNIDNRMKGPKGEIVYIGKNGGRYYLNKNGHKVYIYRPKKK